MPHLLVHPDGLTAIKFANVPQIDAVDGVFSVEDDAIAQLMQSPKFGFLPYITVEDNDDEEDDKTEVETDKAPKFAKMNKTDLSAWLTDRGIAFDAEADTKAVLVTKCLEAYAASKVKKED